MSKSVIKILFTGPESTGKTLLAQQAAKQFKSLWVPEYARCYLETLGRPYVYEDILHIAKKQLEQESILAEKVKGPLFCDTSLLVCKVWAEYKFGSCPAWILQRIRQLDYDYIFLCDTDVPWEYDSLREHPNHREALKGIYQRELDNLDIPYEVLSGSFEERMECIYNHVQAISSVKL